MIQEFSALDRAVLIDERLYGLPVISTNGATYFIDPAATNHSVRV